MAKRRQKSDKQLSPVLQGMRTALIATILFLVYSYSTQALEINLDKPLDPQRQETALRALRALARPDFFTYHEEIRSMDVSIIMPCGDDIVGTQATNGERVATLRPNCASTTQDVLVLTGTGFRPRTSGLLRWHPPGDAPTRALTSFRTDGEGNFEVEFTMSDIREADAPQRVEIEEKWQTGISGLSDASIITIEKIAETVLLALVATTVGTILAVPLSFIAARNLMENVGMPLAALMAGLIAFPVAYLLTNQVMRWLLSLMGTLYANFLVGLVVLVVLVVLIGLIVRFALLAPDNDTPTTRENIVHYAGLLVAVLALMLALAALSFVALDVGAWLESSLGIFGFVGGFIVLMAEFIAVLSPFFVGLFLGLTAMSVASRYGQEAVLKLETLPARILTVVLTGVGTAVVVYGLGSFLHWLYVFDEPILWTVYPAVAGGILAAVGSFFVQPKRLTPVGFTAYTIVRGILNIIRSVEPLVYVIIFAVWVGIGPFAGVLALTLHTVASLGKLFSEQVENIADGPLEAITATGANRLQTIVFAVIPQIVPPYIAFTLYRWDINVRMSTIIGFGGGGGIGFVLAQAINLLQYRQAAVMMIAIAIVVGTLDYISSKVRARIL